MPRKTSVATGERCDTPTKVSPLAMTRGDEDCAVVTRALGTRSANASSSRLQKRRKGRVVVTDTKMPDEPAEREG